jgi:hypothetical protein
MSSRSRKCAQRRAGFEERIEDDLGNVLSVPERGWRYVPVHPMGDELDLLQRLDMKPEDCCKVDLYWAARGDVVFLSVVTQSLLGDEPGLHARWADHRPRMVYLLAIVDRPYVTRAIVEGVMAQAAKFGVHRMRKRPIGSNYRRLSSKPI